MLRIFTFFSVAVNFLSVSKDSDYILGSLLSILFKYNTWSVSNPRKLLVPFETIKKRILRNKREMSHIPSN